MRSVRRRIGKLEKTGLPMDAAYRSLREKVGGNLTGLVRRIDGPISPYKELPTGENTGVNTESGGNKKRV